MAQFFNWRTSGEGMPADHFGYWSFRWATESASTFLDSFLEQPQPGWTLQEAIDDKPFRALLHLTAFFTVPYWLFALDELKIGKDTMLGMQRGMNAAIGDIRDDEDGVLSKEHISSLRTAFDVYLKSERTERMMVLAAGNEAGLQVGKVAALFLDDMYRIYGAAEADTPESIEADSALRQNLLASKTSVYEMLFRELELKAAN